MIGYSRWYLMFLINEQAGINVVSSIKKVGQKVRKSIIEGARFLGT